MEFLSRCCSGKGPHLALREESPGFPRLAAGNLEFLSSYGRDLKDSLVWPLESPVSMRVARSLSGFLSSRFQGRGPHLELRLESQGSSSGPTWISGFLWGVHRGVRCVWSALRHRGSFEILARPLEFLSSIKWRQPPLEMSRECWDSLPDKAG